MVAGVGLTENGEVVKNLPLFAYNSEPHLWITWEPIEVARAMRDFFGKHPWFCLGGTDAVDPDPVTVASQTGNPKGHICTFGFHSRHGGDAPDRRKSARHVILYPTRMMSDKKKARELVSNDHRSLQRFLSDVREWCKGQDIPLNKTLAGIGSSLIRDPRFWPEGRGKVPRQTNERIRPYLPGVHNELYVPANTIHDTVIALDQRRAYHTIAQEIPTPDPSTLFARGRFNTPDTHKIWTEPGRPVYERITKQPGLLAVRGVSRPTRTGETRLPAIDFTGSKTVFLWSNELALAKRQGFVVEGLTAAWTSNEPDMGLPKYGRWALEQINGSSDYRRQWLKPTLHSTYGLFGAKPRTLHLVEHNGTTDEMVTWYFRGYRFEFHLRVMEDTLPQFANSAMLGVLQAEVRSRTLTLATDLTETGATVLHTHADGLHIVADQLPLIDVFTNDRWTADTLTHLAYADRVSYVCEEKMVLPGRSRTQREQWRLKMQTKRKVRRWAGLYVPQASE